MSNNHFSVQSPAIIPGGCLILSQVTLEAISKDRDMTSEAIRILLFLFSKLGSNNEVRSKQKHISESLKIRSSSVSRAIRLLKEKGFITEEKEGREKSYRLNPIHGLYTPDLEIELDRFDQFEDQC
jgi:DNA-binding transcriptional ArsR family regulator